MMRQYDIEHDRFMEIRHDFDYPRCDYRGEIYHYTSPSGLLGIMNGDGPSCLRFTSADYLNDKEEGKYILKVLAKAIERYKAGMPNVMVLHFLESIDKVGNEMIYMPIRHEVNGKSVEEMHFARGRVYICSFSTLSDSLPMWNYYVKGNSYRGYNLGFDATELLEEIQHYVDTHYEMERRLIVNMQSVIYDEDIQLDMIGREIEVLDRYKGNIREFECASRLFIEALAGMKYIFKNPCFAHESEVRAIVNLPDTHETHLRFREGNGGVIVPYLEFECGERLHQVTLSPLVNDELAEYSVGVLLKNNGFEHVKIVKSTCPVRF